MKNKMKNDNGITLLALVLTIVILIILATISINWIFGDNGLVNRTEQAKFEHSKAEARERLELVLADAYVEKNVNKAEYNQNEFLDDFIHKQEPEAKMFLHGDGEVISLNGHAFWLDRSVPQLGEYVGNEENLPPVITKINILGKTTSSVNIEVITTKSDGLKYKYAIKELGQDDESYTQVTEKSENTNEFIGLKVNTVYTVKVQLIKDGEIVNTKTINVVIGQLEKGVVRFEEIVWKNGQASVKILTDETDYTLQYQINGTKGEWINTTSGSVISGLKLKDNVYGRLWSEYGESDPANVTIEDKTAPIVTVTSNGTNTNSITVQVQAMDNESGMADSVTYKYFVKESSQADSSYVQKGNNTTGNYTITGLTQGTSYDVKVEATGDKAGNTGIGYLHNQTTGELPGGEEGVEQGAITFGTPEWSNGQASITINTNTDLQLQYQINSTTGNWVSIANGGKVTGLANNNIVYARLTDGTNYGEYASATIVDDIAPTITKFEATETTSNSITVQVEAIDNESGLASADTYKFYLNDETTEKGKNTTGIFTYTGLNGLTDYKLRVEVYDNAENKKESTINITTKEATADEILDISDNQKIYVEIPNIKTGGTILCNVLYNDDTYGLQVISVNSVEDVTLGYGDPTVTGANNFTKGMNSYNNAITTLNNKALEYIDSNNSNYGLIKDIVEDARCVGSVPNDKNAQAGYFTKYSYVSSKYQIRDQDTNYQTDYNKMKALGITGSNKYYWVASRYVGSSSSGSRFDMHCMDSYGNFGYYNMCNVLSSGSTSVGSGANGLRPVFILNSDIKITGGNGTSSSPYTLGV